MEESRRERLLQAGVDIESALDRFMGKEELLVRFLKKFPADPNFERLQEAMARKDYQDAFKAAHTIKGVCGNLSLTTLFEVASRETELLRSGQYPEAEAVFPELSEVYEKVVSILNSL